MMRLQDLFLVANVVLNFIAFYSLYVWTLLTHTDSHSSDETLGVRKTSL